MKNAILISLLLLPIISIGQSTNLSNKKTPNLTVAPIQARKAGWWIKVNTSKTEASQIVFEIGTDDDNRQFWRKWNSGDPAEFDVPIEYTNVTELYIHASSNPGGKNSWFCMMYKENGVKHFDFDDDEDHQEKQTGHDDECK
ncbi:hypothetical protein [Chitinophaga ginsengisoli]|uniref:Uncharacterized protein n=1 Tax=Chitinophaga ginsengisoli TaxID=363837 RepID=A0A2P8GQ66_9BACT|nr:hypothetical protein [Chitinophaga ginsengisoli]PSL36095.1 hypothetical protein CLV42_101864 [Chitinophaga ginsengisoli]